MTRIPHPCAELPANAGDLLQRYGIRVKVAKFAISEAEYQRTEISKHGWDLQDKSGVVLPYHVYWGPLRPPADVGRTGDIFVDCRACSLWARLRRGWKEWSGPTPTEETNAVNASAEGQQHFNSSLIRHPELPKIDRYLWCKDADVGWLARGVIYCNRRKDMRRLGMGRESCEGGYRAGGKALLSDVIENLKREAQKRERGEEDAEINRIHKKARTSAHSRENMKETEMLSNRSGEGGHNDERNAGPMADVMKAFGKAMEHAMTSHSDDALRAAEVKLQTMQHRISELQLQHLMELNKLQNELACAQGQNEALAKEKEGLEEQLWIETKCHKKTRKRHDKLQGKVQQMHETMRNLFPNLEQEVADDSEQRP